MDRIFGEYPPSSNEKPRECFVYIFEIDTVPRYIGKGRGSRPWDHLYEARTVVRRRLSGKPYRPRPFILELCDALERGAVISIRIVQDGLTDRAAFALETDCIAKAGLANLANVADGGRGLSSVSAKRVNGDPAKRAAAGKTIKARYADPEVKRRHREALVAAKARPEVAARHKAAMKRAWPPERKAEQAARMKGWWAAQPENYRTERSEAQRIRFARIDEAEKLRWRPRAQAAASLPEARARKSASLKAVFAQPGSKVHSPNVSAEVREKRRLERAAYNRERAKDPERMAAIAAKISATVLRRNQERRGVTPA